MPEYGVFDVTFLYNTPQGQRIARRANGTLTSARVEVKEAFTGLAQRLQEMQAISLQEHVEGTGRIQRTTHYLEDAILSPRNRRIMIDGFIVGDDTWLDESPAGLYWRGVEEGTGIHVGQRMYGLWVTPHGFSGPSEALDAFGPSGLEREGQFRGWRSIPGAVKELYRNDRGRLPGFRIRNPIRPYGFLQEGIEEFVSSGLIESAMEAAAAKAGLVQETARARGITPSAARKLLR